MGTRRRVSARTGADWLGAAEALAPLPPRAPDGLDAWNARWRAYAAGTPLVVTAHLSGPIALPHGPLAIDALLAAAVCLREGVVAAQRVEELRPVEVPVVREPAGRFHLASFSVGTFDHHEKRWIHRRFPVAEAQGMAAPSLRRIQINAGPCKSYRIPLEAGHVEGDVLTWYLLGDADAVRDLLAVIHYLGKRRGVGLGRVVRWEVERCEPWPGFPVVSPEGKALRTLPMDWPGLTEIEPGYKTITFPYWRREMEELCAVAARST